MLRIRLNNLWEPAELVRFLIRANIVMFVTALLIAPQAVNTSYNPMVYLSPGVAVLFKLGASGTLPIYSEDRWWTLITANYLHGSLLHLVFNLSALRAVGKITIKIFGPSRFFLIYFLGGAAGMAASSYAGIPLTLGASGAVCALIGSMSYDDWRYNKGNLKMRIASVGVWVVFIAATGLLLPNINNWAHAVGFVSGFILGFCLWKPETYSELTVYRVAAVVCMLTTIGTMIYGLLLSSGI
jgi:rhomboid protease GluP